MWTMYFALELTHSLPGPCTSTEVFEHDVWFIRWYCSQHLLKIIIKTCFYLFCWLLVWECSMTSGVEFYPSFYQFLDELRQVLNSMYFTVLQLLSMLP